MELLLGSLGSRGARGLGSIKERRRHERPHLRHRRLWGPQHLAPAFTAYPDTYSLAAQDVQQMLTLPVAMHSGISAMRGHRSYVHLLPSSDPQITVKDSKPWVRMSQT